MTGRKAQGTIEYLVIIAIVVVIALVVVGLLLQIMNQGSNVPESSAKAAWKASAPIAIMDWSASATDGNIQLVFRNNSADTIVDANISINGGTTSKSIGSIAPGSTTTAIKVPYTCTAGNKFAIVKDSVKITYISGAITSARTESAAADIVGTCS
ncbi:MAG: class III signal peptide-containing protein [archaeon]